MKKGEALELMRQSEVPISSQYLFRYWLEKTECVRRAYNLTMAEYIGDEKAHQLLKSEVF